MEFTDATLMEGTNGDFYMIEGFDADGDTKLRLRVDAKFEGLLRPELDSLAQDIPTSLFVVVDPRRNDPTQFRVPLKYYQDRHEQSTVAQEPTFEPVSVSEGVKDVTTTVPMAVWASLRSGHERQKARFPRFRDYVADVLGRSVALIELG